MMNTAKIYLERYQTATNPTEKTAIVAEYSAWFDAQPPAIQAAARALMQDELKPAIAENVQALDRLMEKAELLLAKDRLQNQYATA